MNRSFLRHTFLGGSIVAAVAASLCCLGPLVAVTLGSGGLVGSALFEKWRPLLLVATFALLLLAWYLTYRKSSGACAEGSTCASKPVSKWNKLLLGLATGIVVAVAAFPSLSSALLRTTPGSAPTLKAGDGSAVLKVKIPSMDCAACAAGIQAKLRKLTGVQGAQVLFDTKEATVRYDAVKLSPAQIVAAIDAAGFKAEPATPRIPNPTGDFDP